MLEAHLIIRLLLGPELWGKGNCEKSAKVIAKLKRQGWLVEHSKGAVASDQTEFLWARIICGNCGSIQRAFSSQMLTSICTECSTSGGTIDINHARGVAALEREIWRLEHKHKLELQEVGLCHEHIYRGIRQIDRKKSSSV